MTLAACLVVFGALAASLLPRVLVKYTAAGHSPRLAVGVWLLAVLGVLLTGAAAAAIILAEALARVGNRATASQACLAGWAAGEVHWELVDTAVATLVTAALVPVLAVLTWRAGRVLGLTSRARRNVSRAVRLIGRPAPDLGAGTLVVDSAERAAYCLSGPVPTRRSGTVVVTTATLASLRRDELAAVIAHERAHLAGRHHVLLGFLAAIRRAAPGVPLFVEAEREVARLLEMCADDAASRRHDRKSLVTALLTMSSAPAPMAALGAGGSSVLLRARRLLAPPTTPQLIVARLRLVGISLSGALTVAGALLLMAPEACAVALG